MWREHLILSVIAEKGMLGIFVKIVGMSFIVNTVKRKVWKFLVIVSQISEGIGIVV